MDRKNVQEEIAVVFRANVVAMEEYRQHSEEGGEV